MLLAGPLIGTRERAACEFLDQSPLVFLGTTQVRTGLSFLGSELRSLRDSCFVELFPAQEFFSPCRPDGSSTDIGEADAHPLARTTAIDRQLRGRSGGGKIADLAFQLEVSSTASLRRDRNADLGHDLAVIELGVDLSRRTENEYDSRWSGAGGSISILKQK